MNKTLFKYMIRLMSLGTFTMIIRNKYKNRYNILGMSIVSKENKLCKVIILQRLTFNRVMRLNL